MAVGFYVGNDQIWYQSNGDNTMKSIRILSLIIVATLLAGCPLFPVPFPFFYSAESIEAWIVDEDTNEPLEGVVVVAEWPLQQYTVAGRIPAGQLKVMETVTDKNGRFYLPNWGPKVVVRGQLDHETPSFIMFKSGYHVARMSNNVFQRDGGIIRSSDWDGKVIKMLKFKENMKKYRKELFRLRNTLDDISEYDDISDCEWKEIPIIRKTIRKEYSNFPPYLEKCPDLKIRLN